MRAGLLVTGVLGTGTVLVFALAALVATLFPNGSLVASSWNGGFPGGGIGKGGIVAPMPMPAPGMTVNGDGGTFEQGPLPDGTNGDISPQP